MSRTITTINLDLTTRCDRRCPDCCCGIGINRVLRDHPWEYFENLAPFIRGIHRVNCTGGEPTFHRRFAEFVPKLKPLFGCRLLTLQTDGWGVERYRDIIASHFDEVFFSDYETRPKAYDTLVQIGVPLLVYPAGVNASNFTPRSRRGSGKPCGRGVSETIAYADGRFWPCCVSPGLDGTKGILPCADWRERVLEVDMDAVVVSFLRRNECLTFHDAIS